MPYTAYSPFQPAVWGQRMWCIYETYSISEKNSAVALLIDRTPSGKQEGCMHLNKNSLTLKQMEKKSLPFSLLQSWPKFNHYLTIANFKGLTKQC